MMQLHNKALHQTRRGGVLASRAIVEARLAGEGWCCAGTGWIYRAAVLALILNAAGCQTEPEHIFVQGKPFNHVVRVTTDQGDRASVVVGQILTLHASRESGPWIAKAWSDAPKDGCWIGSTKEREPEVATSVTWLTEPAGAAVFDLPTASTVIDGPRKVRFTKAGEYRLSAASAITCSREVSNVIVVSVRQN